MYYTIYNLLAPVLYGSESLTEYQDLVLTFVCTIFSLGIIAIPIGVCLWIVKAISNLFMRFI